MIITEQDKQMMREAIRLSAESVKNGGGPFGAVIAKDGEIVAGTSNSVTLLNDPTAHAEVTCIREACRKLHTFDLTGYKIYTSCEPCPMCLYAILWANIDAVYYGCTIEDNAEIGFRDQDFDELAGGREELSDYMICIDREACLELFEEYKQSEHTAY